MGRQLLLTLFDSNGRKLGGILGVGKVREGHELLDEQGSGRGKRLVGGTSGDRQIQS